ncbi:MAG: pantoate--beta-alanine ligase [Acidobacteriaceae bacterium]
MQILQTIADMKSACRAAARAGKTLGFVPTMGALHAGHISLVRAAKAQCDAVAASIFVNPTQFAPNEDLARYPRTFAADCQLLEAEGVDLLFAPDAAEMYPAGATTIVNVEGLSSKLDGASRPGHFQGVATVVSKLFHIVAPDKAFFGQKDAVQVAVLQQMVRDLDFDVRLIVCPIVREADGLALSSRNRYLNVVERQQALVLQRSLKQVESLFLHGERSREKLIPAAQEVFAAEPAARVDYIALVDWSTLLPVETAASGHLFAVAAWIGTTRLIDNLILP